MEKSKCRFFTLMVNACMYDTKGSLLEHCVHNLHKFKIITLHKP